MSADLSGLFMACQNQYGESQTARMILADWLADNPHAAAELLGAALRAAPQLLTPLMCDHLQMLTTREKTWANGREITTGIRLSLTWCGQHVCETTIDTA